MDNIRISLDGRITCWKSKTFTPKSFKSQASVSSEAWDLFCEFEPELQMYCLLHLGSSHVSNSESSSEENPEAVRRGSKGITGHGRSVVREGCQWLEDAFGVKQLSFLTCTLPPKALAEYTPGRWAEILHRFRKSLSYHLEQGGLCPHVVMVTEIQPHRYLGDQRVPPVHIHAVFQGRQTGSPWCYRPDFYQSLWERACESVLASRSEWRSSCRVESLRSSSVSYMGKYMSKGNKGLPQMPPGLCPTSWYSVDLRLRRICKASAVYVRGALAVAYYEFLKSKDDLKWSKDVMLTDPATGDLYYVAWMAQLSTRGEYHSIANDIRDAVWASARVPLTACAML